MPLAALTLDAAGTLIEVAEPVGATYARFAARRGITLDAEETEQRFRAAFEAAPPLAFPTAPRDELTRRERAWWREIVRRAFGRAANHPAFEACFAELFEHFARAAAWRVLPDAPPTLRALGARGLRLAVVSNFDARLPGLLAALGLAPLLEHVIHSTGAAAAKPDPAIFAAAVAALGTAPAETLHVGDRLADDVLGARAAGLRAVILDRAGRATPPPGVPAIASLADLPRLLDALG